MDVDQRHLRVLRLDLRAHPRRSRHARQRRRRALRVPGRPRPERPEFVEWLSREIPYYHLRHVVRPGITGWAQIRYQYGASLAESKEKLEYDLYYIKRASLSFDLMIALESVKIVLLGRGAR